MWFDRKYRNSGWNPALGEQFKIKRVTYEVILVGKNTWTIVDWDTKKQYDLTDEELYTKLKKHGICH